MNHNNVDIVDKTRM